MVRPAIAWTPDVSCLLCYEMNMTTKMTSYVQTVACLLYCSRFRIERNVSRKCGSQVEHSKQITKKLSFEASTSTTEPIRRIRPCAYTKIIYKFTNRDELIPSLQTSAQIGWSAWKYERDKDPLPILSTNDVEAETRQPLPHDHLSRLTEITDRKFLYFVTASTNK